MLDQLRSAAAVEIINLEKRALQITPNAHFTILCSHVQKEEGLYYKKKQLIQYTFCHLLDKSKPLVTS